MAPNFRCPYCSLSKTTRAGVNKHIANTAVCRAAWAAKLGAITAAKEEADGAPAMLQPAFDENQEEEDEPMDSPAEMGDDLVPAPQVNSPGPPDQIPQSRRQLQLKQGTYMQNFYRLC
ncbi:hypothetical protein B0H14DRAFT_2630061 [Mycena olivaceomarginata]|nr:hypothetical protein B0H14DRAFT_2630061 [Mycena olivaceomarginata]